MRAVIIEIYKHHCIAVTPDGRFVKQPVEQGEHEIGDEIMIEAGHLAPGRDWIRALAIAAAAAIVIGLGSWGIIGIFGRSGPASDGGMVAEARVMEEEKTVNEETMVAAEEEIMAEDIEMESEDYSLQAPEIETVTGETGEIEAEFDIEIENIGAPVETVAGNLLFIYWMADSGDGPALLLTIEVLDQELSFTGTIEAAVYDGEGIVSGEDSFDFDGFKRGDIIQEFIPLENGAGILHIRINGVFE